MKIRITGTGLYLPPKVEKSVHIADIIGKSSKWVEEKSGVKERRVSAIDVDKITRMNLVHLKMLSLL